MIKLLGEDHDSQRHQGFVCWVLCKCYGRKPLIKSSQPGS